MRSYVERARVAYPNLKNERKLVEIACSAYNINVTRSTGQKPINGAAHAQAIRDYMTIQRAKNYDKNRRKYKSAEKYFVGDLVYRRIVGKQDKKWQMKESDIENVSKNLYMIVVAILPTAPLPSYKLQDVSARIVLPGSYQANVLVKK